MKLENIFNLDKLKLIKGQPPYKPNKYFYYKRSCKHCNKIRYNIQNQGNFCNQKCKQRHLALKKQKTLNPKEHTKCQICGFLGKDLTKHIINWHNISTKKYLEKYPNAELMYKDIKEKRHNIASKAISEYNKNNVSWNSGLTKDTDERLKKAGKNISKTKRKPEWDKTREKIKKIISEKNKGKVSWNKGLNKNNNEIINLYSKKLKGRIFTDEWKNNIKKAKKNFKINNPEKYKKMCKKLSISSARNNGNKSNKEWKVKYFLDTLNINFLHGKQLFNFQPDFYFPELNKIIEVNGCYWHGCEKCCPDVKLNPKKHLRANLTINNYKRKVIKYKENNIKLLEVWGHEFNNFNNLKQKIIKFLKNGK